MKKSQKSVDKLISPVMPTKEPLKWTMSQKNVDKLMPPVMPTKEPLKQTMSQKNVDKQMPPIILTHREVSAQEAVYRILSLPMKQLSISVVFVDSNPKHERLAMLKDSNALKDLADDDTNVFQKSFINRYEHRPRELQSMCLAEFAATFVAHNNIRLNSLAPESEQYSIYE